jgi:hypothetical protein
MSAVSAAWNGARPPPPVTAALHNRIVDLEVEVVMLRDLVKYLCATDPKLSDALNAWTVANKLENP